MIDPRFRAMADQAPVMIWMSGPDKRRTFFNKGWLDFRGRSSEQEIDLGWTEGLHPGDRTHCLAICEAAFERKEPFETEYRLQRSDGEYCWLLEAAAPFYDESGVFSGYIGSCVDISDRKEAELRSAANEERLQLAAEHARLGAWEWDLGEKVIWTETLEAIYGFAPGEFPGTFEAFAERVHPEDRDVLVSHIQEAVQSRSGIDLEERILLPTGEVRWLRSSGRLVLDEDGRPIRMVGICIDITDRKRAEFGFELLSRAGEALHASLDLDVTLSALAELLVPAFADWFVVDLLEDGELRRALVKHRDPARVDQARELAERYSPVQPAPRGAAKVVRTGKAEMVSEISQEMIAGIARDEEHARILEQLGLVSYMSVPLATHGLILGALTLVTAESGRHYDAQDLRLAEELGRRICRAIENARLYRDSELARAQSQLSNRAKDEFLGIVAHELRSPVSTIFGSARLLKSRWQLLDEETQQEMLEGVEQGALRIVQMVDNLLLLAGVEMGQAPEKAAVDVQDLVEAAVAPVARDRPYRRIEVSKDLKAGEKVYCVPGYVEQMLTNLLTNADKYSPEDQPIEIVVATAEGESRFSVRDRGQGVDPEELPLMFEAFYRSQRIADIMPGKGLGLAVCRRLAEAQDGRVWAQLREGGGLEVGFALPQEEERQTADT